MKIRRKRDEVAAEPREGSSEEAGREEIDPKVLHDTLLELSSEVKAHFGDREPTEDEVQAFLKERLIGQGKSPEEAERIARGDG